MDNLEKQLMVLDLLDEVEIPQPLINYFDYESTRLLDKKIEVLEQLKQGIPIEDIENGYSIFELLEFDQHWD